MFFPNLDRHNIDAPGRGKDGCHGTAQKVRPSSAVLLPFGGWQSGRTARTFRGRHFLGKVHCGGRAKRGGVANVVDESVVQWLC